jgi:hypothetical protein
LTLIAPPIDDRFEAVPVGQRLMLAKFDAINGCAAFTQYIVVNARGFAGDMLEYQDVHDDSL